MCDLKQNKAPKLIENRVVPEARGGGGQNVCGGHKAQTLTYKIDSS